MGMLVRGQWQDVWYDTESNGGRFVRSDAAFRNWVTVDGCAGPTGEEGFKAEPGRYLLYVSLACPWAHRTLIMRALKGLENMIPISVVNWLMLENGWTFDDGPGVIPDPIHGAAFLHQIYTAADADYTGRVTVPVLWDRQRRTIVSNESADILRMFANAFDGAGAREGVYCPESDREEIDASMTGFMTRSTTESTKRASQRPSRLTKKPSYRCSRRSTGSRSGCLPSVS